MEKKPIRQLNKSTNEASNRPTVDQGTAARAATRTRAADGRPPPAVHPGRATRARGVAAAEKASRERKGDTGTAPDVGSPTSSEFFTDLEVSALRELEGIAQCVGHVALYYWHSASFDGIADAPAKSKRALSLNRILTAALIAYLKDDDERLSRMETPARDCLAQHNVADIAPPTSRREAATWLRETVEYLLGELGMFEKLPHEKRVSAVQDLSAAGHIRQDQWGTFERLAIRDADIVASGLAPILMQFVGVVIAGELREQLSAAFSDPTMKERVKGVIRRALMDGGDEEDADALKDPSSSKTRSLARKIVKKTLAAMGLPAPEAKSLFDFERKKPPGSTDVQAAGARLAQLFAALEVAGDSLVTVEQLRESLRRD